LMVHRADLHRLLCECLSAGHVRLNAACTRVATSGAAAVAYFADGSQVEADVIIGADGINSTVRECLFGAQPVRFTQQMAWRWLGPAAWRPRPVGSGPGASG